LNDFNPQLQGEILARRIAKLPAQLLSVSLLKNLRIEWDRPGQESNVVAIALNVPL
jgi:hypothetical protein